MSNAGQERNSHPNELGSTIVDNDATAILPVRIGTALALVALIYCAVTQPISPAEVDGVWWFGAALIASISGMVGLIFLQWRKNRMMRRMRSTHKDVD